MKRTAVPAAPRSKVIRSGRGSGAAGRIRIPRSAGSLSIECPNFPRASASRPESSDADALRILDSVGADSLLGAGDMLYMASDSSKLVRIQGCFVSDEEIKRVVEFWQTKAEPDWLEAPPPWEE